MKTVNEIKALPLEDLQKFVLELRAVPASNKFFTQAQSLIDFAQKLKHWKEPVAFEVTNIADHDITVDGKVIQKGATGNVFRWQYLALARFLEPGKDLAEAIKKVAALWLIAAFLLLGCLTGSAQVQSLVYGQTGSYHVYSINGFNGGTNYNLGTNSFIIGVTNFTYTTNANWSLVNGIPTNSPTITTNFSVNIPGEISVVNYDLVNVFWGFALMSSGTGVGTLTGDFSPDGVNWQLNAINAALVANGTTPVGTNITLSQFGPGLIRFNTMAYPSPTLAQTNVVLEVGLKSSKTGP